MSPRERRAMDRLLDDLGRVPFPLWLVKPGTALWGPGDVPYLMTSHDTINASTVQIDGRKV